MNWRDEAIASPSLRNRKRLEENVKLTTMSKFYPSIYSKSAEICRDGTFHPLGALLFTNGTYKNTIKIIDEVATVRTALDLDTRFQWVYNWSSGTISPSPHLKLSFEALIAEEVARYIALWEIEFRPSLTTLRYKVRVHLRKDRKHA